MSSVRDQESVIVFFAILYNKFFDLEILKKLLIKKFGAILYISDSSSFTYTNYYYKEMGDLYRIFIFFEKKVAKSMLVSLKKYTDKLEHKYLIDGKRIVNIDPGLYSKENIILATNKGYTHRVYLDKGVFADLTLYYKDKTYNSLPWTFKEYQSKEVIYLFNSLRHNLL